MPPRFVVAVIVALLIVAAGYGFQLLTRRAVRASVQEQIAQMSRTPENAPFLDEAQRRLEAGQMPLGQDMGLEVPPQLLGQIELADLLSSLWFVWIGAVFGVCLGIAWMFGKPTEPTTAASPPASAPAPPRN